MVIRLKTIYRLNKTLSTVKNIKGLLLKLGFIEYCGIANGLDYLQDDTVWYDYSEETEDAGEVIDNEVESQSKG